MINTFTVSYKYSTPFDERMKVLLFLFLVNNTRGVPRGGGGLGVEPPLWYLYVFKPPPPHPPSRLFRGWLSRCDSFGPQNKQKVSAYPPPPPTERLFGRRDFQIYGEQNNKAESLRNFGPDFTHPSPHPPPPWKILRTPLNNTIIYALHSCSILFI